MCELLGMSANVPTDICFSLTGFRQRSDHHKDGWGVAFYDGKGCQIFQDAKPSNQSEVAEFLQRAPIKANVVLSHIRQANYGRVCLENTHPFKRAFGGRYWTFVHNGQLKNIKALKTTYYHPVGTTDSEHAFCWMLDELYQRYPQKLPSANTLKNRIKKLCQQLSELGVFNMLLSDGRTIYAFCGKRLSWITRRAPFGLATLSDADVDIDFANETTPNDVVSIIATQPLTNNETWKIMQPGDFQVFRNGCCE